METISEDLYLAAYIYLSFLYQGGGKHLVRDIMTVSTWWYTFGKNGFALSPLRTK